MRRALIGQLRADRAAEVRAALHRLLAEADLRGDRATEEAIKLRIAREETKDHVTPGELFEDEVLLDFLARGRIEDLALPRAGSWLARILPQYWLDRLGIPELAAGVVAIIYAVAAAMLAPKPSDGGLPTGVWLPLVALAAGGLIALIIAHPGGAYHTSRSIVVRISTPVLALALLVAACEVTRRAGEALSSNIPFSATAADAFMLLLAIATWFLADRIRDRLGIPRRQPQRRLATAALPAVEILALLLLARVTVGYSEVTSDAVDVVTSVVGIILFMASWAAARLLPDRLPPPRRAPRQRRALWSIAGGTLRVVLALLPILPAFVLSRYVAASIQPLGEFAGGVTTVAESPSGIHGRHGSLVQAEGVGV
jgi:hypothetical protein